MRGLVSTAAGGPETLRVEELPMPKADANQVLIDVRAVGVNYPDALIIEDRYQIKLQRPFSPGMELAGTVRAVGPGVTRFAAGDRVLAVPGWGGMVETICVSEAQCIAIPDSMPFEDAAVMVATYGTSYYALGERGGLKPGETLLVLGAAGGVGSAAVELGKALGARVIAGVSSEEKLAFARSCGADGGFVYPAAPIERDQKPLADAIKAACGGGADVIYDAVGGTYAEPALRAMNWYGRYLVVGFPAGIPKLPMNLVLLKSCQIVGVIWGAWAARDPKGYQQQINELIALHQAGKIKPRISRRYRLDNAAEAIRELGERRALGKLVVTI